MSSPAPHRDPAVSVAEATEAALVAAARAGDEAAIRELIRRLNPRLFRVARGIARSDAEAEEIVQESYLAAFGGLAAFRGEARFSTWITRIAVNAALQRRRRAQADPAHEAHEGYDTVTESDVTRDTVLPFPGGGAAQPEAEAGRRQVREMLEQAVAELPPELRIVFLLREAEGMSTLAVARDLALNPVTVKTRLFRARQRLRRAIERRLQGGFDAIFPFAGRRCAALADRVVAALPPPQPGAEDPP
ncbi:RNA polymerase sigma factor [Paralimibaculum aggregatum]|uniref:RNA polymerase sigma factor n=1 Tax=Paralimibaculum aggregatum TaxID=3036245 RepID=A0ABQ6LSA8_9RHOB|nr:RNA polymerase sigma factor [Limibaculum sp. NKW23]GMG84921.1 RNA polymerase sigma factor [Limibaculum sp. NKW23]